MASRGKGARQKGHDYERRLVIDFKTLGELLNQEEWKDCGTSRYLSKETDDKKVDLCKTNPFNIQAKATERSPSYHSLLKEMPNDDNLNVIFHKRNNQGEVVAMDKGDFYKLLQLVFGS